MIDLNAPRLRRRILRNQCCSYVFNAGFDVYVIGGYLRDLLLTGKSSRDIDFAVNGSPRRLASTVAREFGGRVVDLRKERMMRVVLKEGVTLDFARMNGDIVEDLGGRDFTINAMGWSPDSGLIDPHSGLRDLRDCRIKAISRLNLLDDPLRILRAYRFSAELGFTITASTRRLILPISGRLRSSARERITYEFFRLLNAENPISALKSAHSDGVLSQIISINNRQLQRNLKLISTLSSNSKKLLEKRFFKEFSQGLSRLGLLRLELLMLGARLEGSLLAVSSDIRKRINVTGELYNSLNNDVKSKSSELFDIFWEARDASEDLLIITDMTRLFVELRQFNRIMAKGLMTAEEIMETSGISGGPGLGRLIKEMKRLRFMGRLRTIRDAGRWISGLESY